MYYIGVDLGGTNIATGIMDKDGNLIYKCQTQTLGHRPPEEITKDIAGTVFEVIKETNTDIDEIKSIGVGIPGCVDNAIGKVILTNNMNFSDFNFVSEMKKYIDKPIFMGNDANCAALGEMVAGAAKGFDNAVMITIGTGIGGGFIVDKKVYSGFNGAAMEVGHMSIESDGKKCNCGRQGCWELYASATGLIELTKEYIEKYDDKEMLEMSSGKISGRTAFDAARKGNETALLIVDKFTYYLSMGVANLINLFQPEVFIIGGGISNEGDFLLDRVRYYISKNTYAYGKIPDTVIKKAHLGNDAGIIGAGFLS